MPARITDGCGPTASTYAAIAASATTSAAEARRSPSSDRKRNGAARDDEHVAAAHGEQVVETRRAEALPQRVGEAAVLAEDDPFEDRAPLSRETGRRGACEPAVQPVGDAAAQPEHPPRSTRAARRARRDDAATRVRSRAAPARCRAPRGGLPAAARACPGSCRSTGSCTRAPRQRRTTARTCTSQRPRFGGSATVTTARPAVPMLVASTLRSSASSRALPHHQPASRAGTRLRRGARHERRQREEHAHGDSENRTAVEAARPTASAPRRDTARGSRERRGPSVARCAPRRSPAPRRAPRASGTRRAPAGSRRSSARSTGRCRAARRAARPRPS